MFIRSVMDGMCCIQNEFYVLWIIHVVHIVTECFSTAISNMPAGIYWMVLRYVLTMCGASKTQSLHYITLVCLEMHVKLGRQLCFASRHIIVTFPTRTNSSVYVRTLCISKFATWHDVCNFLWSSGAGSLLVMMIVDQIMSHAINEIITVSRTQTATKLFQ